MKRILFLLMVAMPIIAHAATYPVINGAGQLQSMNAVTDPIGAFSGRQVTCDAINPDNCANVVSGALTVAGTVAQPTASLLNATVVQLTPANLMAQVSQPIGTNLHVVVDSCTGCAPGSGFADETAFVPGTTNIVPSGGFFQTTATNNALTDGRAGSVQLTSTRAVFTNLRNAAGTEIGTAGAPVQVSLANTATNATPVVVTSTLNQAGSALSVTNGLYTNLLQGNAVVAAGNPLTVASVPLASGGLVIQSAIVANNTTSVAVGTSAPHQIYGIDAYSISSATPAFIKLYNATQGSTTCGSGTPLARFMIPASGGTAGSGQIWHDANGIAFGTALTYCVTTGIADADTSAPAASTYILNISYQ